MIYKDRIKALKYVMHRGRVDWGLKSYIGKSNTVGCVVKSHVLFILECYALCGGGWVIVVVNFPVY